MPYSLDVFRLPQIFFRNLPPIMLPPSDSQCSLVWAGSHFPCRLRHQIKADGSGTTYELQFLDDAAPTSGEAAALVFKREVRATSSKRQERSLATDVAAARATAVSALATMQMSPPPPAPVRSPKKCTPQACCTHAPSLY